jgi:hypothetical protein
MSVGSLGGIVAGAAAGTSLAQAKGADVERSEQDTTHQQRQVQGQTRAEAAAGIGQADGQDHEASERDADGRQPWQLPTRKDPLTGQPAERAPQAKDVTGQSGTQLDLSG